MENRNRTVTPSRRGLTENLPKMKWRGFCLGIALAQEVII